MSLHKIARLGHPVIRGRAEPITQETLKSEAVQRLIDDMVETMRDADGVGIAAPQVHVPQRIIVIEIAGNNPRYPRQNEVPLTIIVNPEIVSHSTDIQEDWEGCLSVPDLRGRVPRWKSLQVEGWDRHGKPVAFQARNFFARVIQHEIDHLNGKVYLDRMPDLSTLSFLREWQRYWLNQPT